MYEKIPIIKECDIDDLLWLEKKKSDIGTALFN
jgi:hypothetical protein